MDATTDFDTTIEPRRVNPHELWWGRQLAKAQSTAGRIEDGDAWGGRGEQGVNAPKMIGGLAIIAIALLVTFASFDSDGGGIVFYGAVLWGLVTFAKGLAGE